MGDVVAGKNPADFFQVISIGQNSTLTDPHFMHHTGGNEMTQPANQNKDTIFDEKTQTLIAIGAATASNCIPCIEHLYEKAITCGLTAEQIKKASVIAGQVKKGANAAISNSIHELIGDEAILESHCMQTTNKSCCS